MQCRARIEEITRENMGQNTKVDGSGAFARFQRGKELFKEKNKVEIRLDTNYYSGKNVSASTTTSTSTTSKPTSTSTTTSTGDEGEKKQGAEKGKGGEVADENGWTQSQQKALET